MRLIALHPEWDDRPEDGRHGVGIWFDCPTCPPEHETRLHIWFANPIDGGPTKAPDAQHGWRRTGDTFDSLTATPSVDCSKCGHWHGFITNGDLGK